MGERHARPDQSTPSSTRFEYRPSKQGTGSAVGHRPGYRSAAWGNSSDYRQCAVLRVRPTAGLDHVQAAESVPRCDGGRTLLSTEPGCIQEHLCTVVERSPGAIECLQSL